MLRDPSTTATRGGKASGRGAAGERDRRATGDVRLPYLPGLDGLRALAVIAVLLYHAELGWIPGGFLGVEVFFVISGYLITALLLAQWRQSGRIDLKGFWLGRARRLLPALYLMVLLTLAYAVLFLPHEVAGLREEAISALGYVTNWYLVLAEESYFEATGRPSLLKHLWSLAVEEQFYLLWPVVLALGLRVGAKRWRERRVLLLVALIGAGASALVMGFLYRPEVDPSRVYFGTDTRATGLLIGAALALLLLLWRRPWWGLRAPPPGERGRSLLSAPRRWSQLRRRWGWTTPLWLEIAGLFGLGILVWLSLWVGEFEPFLYRGGMVGVGLASALVIMVVVHPQTRLVGGRVLLGSQPLRWVGVRSYGIYLWHWPIFMLTRPHLDVRSIEGLPLLGVRVALTLLLAGLSYRYVERPIREGGLERAWRKMRKARGFGRWELGVRWAGAVVPAVVLCAVVGVAVAQAEPPEPPSYLSTKKVHIEASHPTSEPGKAAAEKASAPESAAVEEEAAPTTGARETRPEAHRDPAPRAGKAATTDSSARAPTVTAIGDSAMLGAVDALQQEIPNLVTIDARGSRQAPEAIGVLWQLRATGELGDVVIVHIGNNGVFADEHFDEMMRALRGVRKVLIVNVTVPEGHSWVPNNEVLAAGVRRYPNEAVLVDWYGTSVDHPEYFWDGIHLTPQGAWAYADLISAAYEAHG